MTTTDQVIEDLIAITHGHSDARTQHIYRQALCALAELARAEGRREAMIEVAEDVRRTYRGTAH